MKQHLVARLLLTLALLAGLIGPTVSSTVSHAASDATRDEEIIYIDGGGFIRVIDPNVAEPERYQAIQWVSPEGGWFDFATGDVNNDGDMEIIAIGNGKLTVFDPVVRDPALTPDGEYNLVPWKRLYEQAVPGGAASLVAAGNMDQNVPGDEIIYGFSVSEPNNINYRLHVLKTTNNGLDWVLHLDKGFAASWKSIDVGNVNNTGSEDVALTREAGALLEVREIDNDFRQIFGRDDADFFVPVDAVIGQVYAGGTGEVVYIRSFSGTAEQASLLITQFADGQWKIVEDPNNYQSDDSAHFYPHPTDVFVADVNGNGDDEILVLRAVSSTATFARLFMLNRGTDTLPRFETPLDGDGGWTVGAGGDVDGDGRDEVVIMRNNRIRNYYAVENDRNTELFTDYANITTNSRSLVLADLDADGFAAGPRFSVDKDSITVTLTAGNASNVLEVIRVQNVGTGGAIPFSVAKEGSAGWFTMTFDNITSGDRIGSIYLTNFDASDLTPGTYTENLVITSPDDSVINLPLTISVTLVVEPAPFALDADFIGLSRSVGDDEMLTRTVALQGMPGLTFSAALLTKPAYDATVAALGGAPRTGYVSKDGELVLFNADGDEYRTRAAATKVARAAAAITWPSGIAGVTVQSAGDTVPDTLSLTMDPNAMTEQSAWGVLLVLADERAGETPKNLATADVLAIKDALTFYLSRISR